MNNTTRLAGYTAQNGSKPLTGPQLRRLRRHDPDRPAPEVEQHFARPVEHKPSRRLGRMRWGVPLSKHQLDKLFSRVLVPLTGREVSTRHFDGLHGDDPRG